MPRLAMGTAYRIAGFYAASFAVATLLLGFASYYVAHHALQHQLDQRVMTEMAELQQTYEQGGFDRLVQSVAAREELRGARNLGYIVADRTGRRIAGGLNVELPPTGWSNQPFRDARNSDDSARVLAVALPDGIRLAVGANAEPIEEIDETLLSLFAIASGVMLAVGVAGSYLLGGFVNRRLEQLNSVANAIIDGELARRMPVSGSGDEFDRLSETLNRMLERIQSLMANLRQVSSDIAHDLRTPLTRMRQQIESALSRDPSSRDRTALEEAGESIDQVLSLFSAILRIAEVEAGGIRRTFRPVDLSSLAEAVVESFGPSAEDTGMALSHRIDRNVEVAGDADLLAQLLTNLLDNALAHTPQGARVCVELVHRNVEAILSVIDDGPGVPLGERERLLRPFTRLEHSRSSPGHGLGLSLVAAVAAAHDARLDLEDAHPGLAVRIKFPTLCGAPA